MELLDELRHANKHDHLAGTGGCLVPHELVERAIEEIEHLRSLAGAVSQGQTFAEVKAEGRIAYNVYDAPVLKAFDGA